MLSFSSLHCCNAHARFGTVGGLRCNQSLGFPVLQTNALVVSILKQIDDVLENLFLDFFTCSRKNKSTFAMCVSKSCVCVTRAATHCVCDHEDFMSFDVALFFNKVFSHLRNTWYICRRFLDMVPSIFHSAKHLSTATRAVASAINLQKGVENANHTTTRDRIRASEERAEELESLQRPQPALLTSSQVLGHLFMVRGGERLLMTFF